MCSGYETDKKIKTIKNTVVIDSTPKGYRNRHSGMQSSKIKVKTVMLFLVKNSVVKKEV
jgi:hypothetical protein